MADTVNVPGVGATPKRNVAIGLAVLAGILGVAYYRHAKSQQAASAASTAASTATPADTTIPATAYDPNAGLTGVAGSAGPYSQGYYNAPGSYPQGYVTNGQWAQAAEAYLTSIGADPTTVGLALGKYLTGQTVTTAQQDVIDQAIAFANYPPVNGPGGYPPNIRLHAPTPPPGPKPGPQTRPHPHLPGAWNPGKIRTAFDLERAHRGSQSTAAYVSHWRAYATALVSFAQSGGQLTATERSHLQFLHSLGA